MEGLGAVSSRNILEEVEQTGCQTGSWVRDKDCHVCPAVVLMVCSNTSKQRFWLGFWRSWSHERWWHTKSHKAAGRRCYICSKFKRVYTSDAPRSLVGLTLPFTPFLSLLHVMGNHCYCFSYLFLLLMSSPSLVIRGHGNLSSVFETKVGAEAEDVNSTGTTAAQC